MTLLANATHGRQYAYKAGCHCDECKAWNAANARAYRQRRIARGWKLIKGKWVMVQDSHLPS